MDTNDWRPELLPHTRQINFHEIMGKLMIYQSHDDDDELLEVQKIAQNIEHKIYAGAASQEDYLQEISSMKSFIGYYWRIQALPESRRRSVNEIAEVLRRHLPYSCQEGLAELYKIAIRFEEKVYNSATSQTDYFRQISMKMLTMETKSQNRIANSLPSNFGDNRNGPLDTGSMRQALPEGQVEQSEGLRNASRRQSVRKRKQPQRLAEFVTY